MLINGEKYLIPFRDAIRDIHDGATLVVGGFGLCGIPENLIIALRDQGSKDLTVVSNNCGVDGWGLGLLLENKQIKKMVASYVGENKTFEAQYLSGEIEVDLVPQGTLAERIRAGGAGIPAFYTATGVGTPIAEGKEVKEFKDVNILWKKDCRGLCACESMEGRSFGNLVFRKTSRNFNPLAATAGKTTIVEVEELVGVGELDPDEIHTPGIYVQRIVKGARYEKRIERLMVQSVNGGEIV